MKRLFILLLVAAMLLTFSACAGQQTAGEGDDVTDQVEKPAQPEQTDNGGESSKESGEEIIFGLTTPVTGPQAAGGEQAQKGMELAIEQINNRGGIELSYGLHKIKLLVEDDQGDSTLCDTTVRRLVSNGAVCIFGPYFSGQTIALDGTMRELQVPLINSATSIKIPELENPWIWRNRCDDGINVLILGKAVMADYEKKNGSLDGLKVGIVCVNDETGTSAAESYMQYFDEHGVEYYVDYHNKDDTDLTAYIQKAISAGCNAWVSSTHDTAAVALAKAMYEAGLRDQIVYMNPIIAQSQVIAMMENEWIEGWGCVADYSETDTINPLSQEFTKSWNEKYNGNPTPDVMGALYYAHTLVIEEAIKNADSYEPKAIRDAIAELNGFETLIGRAYADEYTNLIYEIGVAKIYDGVPTMVERYSMAEELGFGVNN